MSTAVFAATPTPARFASSSHVTRPRPRMGKGGIQPRSPGKRVGATSDDNNSNDANNDIPAPSPSTNVDDIAAALGGAAPARERAIAGIWIGESWPAPELLAIDPSVPTNPIRWSLALDPAASAPTPSAFGAGTFDDSGDIPGEPVIWFTLRGTFDALTRAVKLRKVYERPVPESEVKYEGRLHALNGAPEITGVWRNSTSGTNGTFSCTLQESGRTT
ncbi:uncharacterized protein MICPUCDRAFT_52354 [Micromonas pusilla CCMP1545]|jgi:hypothetical protein|uniref:Predicted protein n=1 Tax=Micromonas pusilla (strain CCMP1545) TaxID=564608 RepID=C1N3Z6_MICPC|nr:uncharacterized protein MICPUCDRAFT_52354 [Micromonas pusilla CCMP1545]EEH53522.1 predicted protein [Micromonas pusilla CCMP1545]|eukprot:XP_003062703.1 predicted protein [Micromonas pusilla CCMP1545]